MSWTPGQAAEPVVSKEYQLKAAFLYNFIKFVDWPSEKFPSPDSPIILGVFGANPFGDELEHAVQGRRINGREIIVREIKEAAEAGSAHLLFVGAGEDRRIEGLVDVIQSGRVLGVGESEAFLKAGGTIRFLLEGDKVRFEIDMNSADRARLRISAQLQKLAKTVRMKT